MRFLSTSFLATFLSIVFFNISVAQNTPIIEITAPEIDYDGTFTIDWAYASGITCSSFSLFLEHIEENDEVSYYDPSEDCSIRSNTFSGLPSGTYKILISLDYTENGVTKRASARVTTIVDDRRVDVLGAGFEQDFEGWILSSHEWTRRSGATPSSNTGPTTASSGNYYVYMETSSGHAYDDGDEAILTSPAISLNDGNLSFDYHMYGSDMGKLQAQILNDQGSWQTLWERAGPVQTLSTQSWRRVSVSLDGFQGDYKIRFVGEAYGGYKGDMAVDNVEVKTLVFDADVPTGLSAEYSAYPHGLIISWSEIIGANNYEVSRSLNQGQSWENGYYNGSEAQFVDDNIDSGTNNIYYRVRACNTECSDWSSTPSPAQ